MARKPPEIPSDTLKTNFDYEYPDGLNLHPDSDLHRKIVDYVWRMGNDSADVIGSTMPSGR